MLVFLVTLAQELKKKINSLKISFHIWEDTATDYIKCENALI